MFTFQHISDTEAIMTGTGSPDLGLPTGPNEGTYSNLELRFVFDSASFGPADGAAEQTSGDFLFGDPIPGWSVIDGDMLGTGFFGGNRQPAVLDLTEDFTG